MSAGWSTARFSRAPRRTRSSPRSSSAAATWRRGERRRRGGAKKFFAGFGVSVMLDSNGSNTTAAAAVACLAHSAPLAGKKAVVLAGTGPVGMRAAFMLSREGAQVGLSSRTLARAQAACQAIKTRFGVDVTPLEGADERSRARDAANAHVVLSTGAAAAQLLAERSWKDSPTLQLLCDANATPPAGIEGIDIMAKRAVKNAETAYGAIGFGSLKIALHGPGIARLFASNVVVVGA